MFNSVTSTSCTEAILIGANLSNANVSFCNMSGAILEGADLTDIKYNDETIWPEGFEPPVSR